MVRVSNRLTLSTTTNNNKDDARVYKDSTATSVNVSTGDTASIENIKARRRARRTAAQAAPTRTPRLSRASRILSGATELADVMATVPLRFRFRDLQCVYSTADDGISLTTLYSRVKGTDPVVLLVRDSCGATFGAYSSIPYTIGSNHYAGSGESFVFSLRPDVHCYPWTRNNTFFHLCSHDSLAIGGGGHFALFLDSMLERGSSGPSSTFGNTCLASQPNFDIVVVEVFKLVVSSRLSIDTCE